MGQIRVMLVDDQALLLDGLKAILETDDGIRVTATASSGERALAALEQAMPDVVLMDIRMPGMNGVECTRQIKARRPETAVLMLTTFNDTEYIVDALQCGACGYLLKDITGDKLIRAVRDASAGDTILPSSVAAQIAGKLSEKPISREGLLKERLGLTDREAEMAVMLSQGFTNKQIAAALYISEGTVKNTVSAIYRKLEIEDRTAAAIRIREITQA